MVVRVLDVQTTGEHMLLRLVARLLQRVNDLERRVAELKEWLTEVCRDLPSEDTEECEPWQ